MKQRSEIKFETEETIVLRKGSRVMVIYCRDCEQNVAMSTPWIAAAIYGSSEREVFRLLESGVFHFIEEDRVLVCLNSLNAKNLIEGEIKQ